MSEEYPKVVLIEAVLMANGELIHYGKSLGFANRRQVKLVEDQASKSARGGEPIVALGENVA